VASGKIYLFAFLYKQMGRSSAILIAFAVETLCVTWLLKIPGWTPFFSILYLASGVGIACWLLMSPAIRLPAFERRSLVRHTHHYRVVLIGMLALVMYSWCRYWFEEMPLDISNADMLPIIKVMGERFIAGQHSHIYDSIPWIWHGTQPIYLPAMWLPYVPAIAIGIDMRWVTMAGLLFAFGAFLLLYRPPGGADRGIAGAGGVADGGVVRAVTGAGVARSYRSFFLGVLAFLLFWWIVADNTAGIVSVSEEGTVIGYYTLLVLAILSGRPWLIGIAISLCMLSRYALVGWVPAYLLYLVLEKRWRSFLIIALTGMFCFMLLFLLPVGWATFVRLALLPGHYIGFAARVWKDSPDVFWTAPGLAYFFGPRRIALLHGWLVTLSFGVPPGLVLFCRWQSRKRSKSRKRAFANIPLAALKMTLVVFYCFIDVPYLYLFYTSSIVSLIAVTLLFREEDVVEGR
jgi:hypothetical protein